MAKETIDPLVAELLEKYQLPDDAVWKLERKNKAGYVTTSTWIMKHRWIEKVAGMSGIRFQSPDIIEHDLVKKVVAILVTGCMGKYGTEGYREEWSIGEAAPYNTKIGYPFAMAEKRAKDRVVLKLLDIHGLVYSEEEADDFKLVEAQDEDGAPTGFQSPGGGKSAYAMKKENPEAWNEAVAEITDCRSHVELDAVDKALQVRFKTQNWPVSWGRNIRDLINKAHEDIDALEASMEMPLEEPLGEY